MTRVVEYVLIVGWKPLLVGAFGFGLGNPKTRGATWTAAKWSVANVLRPIGLGMATAAANVARVVVLPIVTGYVIGATAGTWISGKLFGESGKQDALELYSGKVSWDQYWSTVGEGFEILIDDWF